MISFHHILMFAIGIWLLVSTVPSYNEVLLSTGILAVYALFMWDKLDAHWIVDKTSKIPIRTQRLLVRTGLITFYILLPVLRIAV